MLCDLNLDPSEPSVIIDTFGGLKICVTQMQAALALRTGAKIVPVECRPESDGTYRMVYRKPLDFRPGATAAEVTQLCWNVLEPSIHEQPECWLWAYKHWRFRPGNDQTGRYPFMPMSPSASTRCCRNKRRVRFPAAASDLASER